MSRLFPSSVCAAVVAAVGGTAVAQQASDIGAVLDQWAGNYGNVGSIDPDDPHFADILKRPDADLIFLQGLRHFQQPIRRFCRLGLATLKTDRSFDALVGRLDDPNMFVREAAVKVLADFRQPRCIPVLLRVLEEEPKGQIVSHAIRELRHYDDRRVIDALSKILEEGGHRASTAAGSLGVLGVEEAIEPTFQLIFERDHEYARERALFGLIAHRRKRVVSLLIDLMERLPESGWRDAHRLASIIDSHLLPHARKTERVLGPLPDTVEQFKEWWIEAEPLFTERMELRKSVLEPPEYAVGEFGKDPGALQFSVAVKQQEYRVGDPIRIEVSQKNRPTQPYRVLLPEVPSAWSATIAYGIRLEKLKTPPVVLVDIKPSGSYIGSYSSRSFETLHPRQTFTDSTSIQYWLRRKKIWPLEEGRYKLSVVFDSSTFPVVMPDDLGIMCRWTAPAVFFTIAGAPRRDPTELFDVVADAAEYRWLKTDLTSRHLQRRKAARWALYEYGDDRLRPILAELVDRSQVTHPRSNRSHPRLPRLGELALRDQIVKELRGLKLREFLDPSE